MRERKREGKRKRRKEGFWGVGMSKDGRLGLGRGEDGH
jgi:hypothetical protein